MKELLFIASILLGSLLYAQEVERQPVSDVISDCTGASNILQTGTYELQFTGKDGLVKDLSAYPSLKDYPEKNSLWLSFKAGFNGRFTLEADVASGCLQMIVFENETKDVCEDIATGKAEIRRLINSKDKHVGLNLITSDNTLYPIDLLAGKHIMICFLYPTAKEKPKLSVNIKFEPTDGELKEASTEGKTVDLRKDKTKDALSIMIRDVETGNPIVANMSLIGIRELAAAYQGSDFLITVEKSGKLQIKVDAEGYFFVDREEPVSAGSENEVVIWMEPLGEGKSMQIDEIEFEPGSSTFLSTAEPKLRRLKDFLALNASVNVEIQGHVHATGENTFAGQKLSEARAKRVLLYLTENGIAKDRLTSVGYGNTKPIFPNAQFSYEEQSNRRVEIKVL